MPTTPNLSPQDLRDAAALANMSYSDNPTNTAGLTLLSSINLRLTGQYSWHGQNSTISSPYVYDVGNSQAVVAINGQGGLVLAFRGSNNVRHFLTDIVGGVSSFTSHYGQYAALISAVEQYAADSNNHISNIQVTGHSLGGAMVEMFMANHLPGSASAIQYTGVSFGSPGERSISNLPGIE